MKKLSLILILGLGLAGLGLMSVVMANTPGITIDGIINEPEWGEPWFIDGDEPHLTGYLAFDEANLYLAFVVLDDTPNTNRDFLYVTFDIPPVGVFNEPVDALYWGSTPGNPSFFGEAYLTGNAFPWDKSQRSSTWGEDGGVETARTIGDTERVYELRVPFVALGAQPGDDVGIQIQAREGDYPVRQNLNYYPDLPEGLTPVRPSTRVETEGVFAIVTIPIEPIEATVEINPETLNLRAQGKWITGYIGLPEDYDVEDIDVSTVQLVYEGEVVTAEWGEIQNGVLMVKFDRVDVTSILEVGDAVEVSIVGEVNETPFEGTTTIRVIDPVPLGRGR